MMKTLALVATAIALAAGAAQAKVPRPDPAPGAHGPIHWVSYSFTIPSVDGKWLYRCYVPVHGKRHCVLLGRRKP